MKVDHQSVRTPYSSNGFKVRPGSVFLPRGGSIRFLCLSEFHDEKDYRKRGGPPRATGYENALRSIEACTTKYKHPMELAVLTGVGPTCIDRCVYF